VLAAACSRSAPDGVVRSEKVAMDGDAPAAMVAEARARDVPAALAKAVVQTTAAGITAPPTPPSIARMIVRTAELTLQVSDVRKTAQQVADATTAAEGFLGASRVWRDGELDRASMTVRVPSAKLDATIARLRQMAVRVDNESVTGEDVTRQAVDLTAQLTNLRATETELRALLTTVRLKTQRASDVLEVHTELARVRGEIDQHAAELQSLSQLAALSTITLELRPDVVASPIAAESWQPRGVLRDALRALAGAGRVGVNAMIWALVWAIPTLLLVLGVRMSHRAIVTRRRVAG
jgi:Domain of unknown function (DUF4349)